MDIKREPPKKTKKYIAMSVGLVGIVAVSMAISRLKPAAPPVERGTLWFDTVKYGSMTVDVNAPGTLEPEDPRNITALTSGRIDELPVKPGQNVTPSTVLLVMSSPDENIKELTDEQALNQAIGALAQLKTTLHQGILTQEGVVANMHTQYNNALRQAAVMDSLAAKRLASANDIASAHDQVAELKQRMEIEKKRLDDQQTSEGEQIKLQQEQIESLRAILDEQKRRVASMRVVSPEAGQLQILGAPGGAPLELGQYVNAGTIVARVVQPGKLKAVLRVPENQAKDVVPGLAASIDLHNNTVVKGHVTRTDPSSVQGTVTVEVSLDDKLPAGTRSDLAVDGTITIQKLSNVKFIGRPGFGQAESSVGIFLVDKNKGEAHRVTVQLGTASVNQIVVKNGLQVGDSVIISDMSQFDNTNRVRIK